MVSFTQKSKFFCTLALGMALCALGLIGNSPHAFANPTAPGIAMSTNWTGDHYVNGDFTLTTTGSTDSAWPISYYKLCRSNDANLGEVRGCEFVMATTTGPNDKSVLVTGTNRPSYQKQRWYYWIAVNSKTQETWGSGQYVHEIGQDTIAPSIPGAPVTSWTRDHYVNADFTLTTTGSTDNESGVSGYSLCRSNESSGEWRGCEAWVSQNGSSSVLITGANKPSNGKFMWYYWYATDYKGNLSGNSAAGYVRMDTSAPTYNQTTFSGCSYETGNDCWVKNGQTFYVNLQHTENPSTMNVGTHYQFLEFSKNNSNVGSWTPSTGNIKSYAEPYGTTSGSNYSAFVDGNNGPGLMVDNAHLDIQSVQCLQTGDCSTIANGAWKVVTGSGADANYGVTTYLYDGLSQGVGYTQTGKWVKIDNTLPTNDALTISTQDWRIDDNSSYTITAKITDAGSGISAGNGRLLVLINGQGSNSANPRGQFAWDAVTSSFTQDQLNCTGGGKASKDSNYNGSMITLTGCSTSITGNQRTVIFTVRPSSTFGQFDSMNDIALQARDAVGNQAAWQNYDLNFSSYGMVSTVNCGFDASTFANKTKGALPAWIQTCGASFANFLIAAGVSSDTTLTALQAANTSTFLSTVTAPSQTLIAKSALKSQGAMLEALRQKMQTYVCSTKLSRYNRSQIINDYHLSDTPFSISTALSCS